MIVGRVLVKGKDAWCLAGRPRRGPGSALQRGLALLVVSVGLLLAPPSALQSALAQSDPARAALDALDAQEFDAALSHAGRVHDPLLRTIVQWARLKEGLGTFDTIASFIEAHSDWPHIYTLRRAAEGSLTGGEEPRRLVAWFDRYPPLTTDGLVARARALLAVGPRAEAIPAARAAWVEGRFDAEEQRAFLEIFGGVLARDDHIERLSGLLWDERLSEAERMLTLVDTGQRWLAEARMRLIADRGGVDAAIARVPDSLKDDPGLVYDRLVWRLRHGMEERAADLLLHPSANRGRPEAWAEQRAYLAREAIQDRRWERAYHLSAAHGHDGGLPFAVGEWTAGWLALRFLDDPGRALRHFETMHAGVSYPQSASRAAYWAGRAAAALGRDEQARSWYKTAAVHAETFYGQLAIQERGESLGAYLEPPPLVTEADRARLGADERARVIETMDRAGRADMALPFVLALDDDDATPGFRHEVARFLAGTSRPDLAVFFARRAALSGTMLTELAYPLPDAAVLRVLGARPETGPRPEPALMLSLMRQESNFNTDAVSRAGARGLMQLMPGTADRIARRIGETTSRDRLTDNPAHNARLGTAYFAHLLDEFQGSIVLAIAAYNAGPSRAARWVRENGDPRGMTADAVVDWIERITFAETRNYVQRVLEGAWVYRHRLGEDPVSATLADDMTR